MHLFSIAERPFEDPLLPNLILELLVATMLSHALKLIRPGGRRITLNNVSSS